MAGAPVFERRHTRWRSHSAIRVHRRRTSGRGRDGDDDGSASEESRAAVRGVSPHAVTRAATGSRDSARSFALPSATARAVGRPGLGDAPRDNQHDEPASIAFDRSFAPRQTAAKELRDALSAYLAVPRYRRRRQPSGLALRPGGADQRHRARRRGRTPDCRLRSSQPRCLQHGGTAIDGCGFDPAVLDLEAPPDPLSERGRGLFLIHHLMDDVEIVSDSHGTTIRMTLHLKGKAVSNARLTQLRSAFLCGSFSIGLTLAASETRRCSPLDAVPPLRTQYMLYK